MIEIQAIDHVVLRTVQLEAMLNFYTKVLGCELEKTQPDIGLYQLRAGTDLIDLLAVNQAADLARPNLDHLCLRLARFDAEVLLHHLEQHHVGAGEIQTRYGAQGSGPSLYIQDPDGNTVELKAPAELPPA